MMQEETLPGGWTKASDYESTWTRAYEDGVEGFVSVENGLRNSWLNAHGFIIDHDSDYTAPIIRLMMGVDETYQSFLATFEVRRRKDQEWKWKQPTSIVDIRDPVVFREVSHIDAIAFLSKTGWIQATLTESFVVYRKGEPGKEVEVVVPLTHTISDYAEVIQTLVRKVSESMKKTQLEVLNAIQLASLMRVHPATCGGDRGDDAHKEYQAIHGGDFGELVQTENGLICPVCGWKQPSLQ